MPKEDGQTNRPFIMKGPVPYQRPPQVPQAPQRPQMPPGTGQFNQFNTTPYVNNWWPPSSYGHPQPPLQPQLRSQAPNPASFYYPEEYSAGAESNPLFTSAHAPKRSQPPPPPQSPPPPPPSTTPQSSNDDQIPRKRDTSTSSSSNHDQIPRKRDIPTTSSSNHNSSYVYIPQNYSETGNSVLDCALAMSRSQGVPMQPNYFVDNADSSAFFARLGVPTRNWGMTGPGAQEEPILIRRRRSDDTDGDSLNSFMNPPLGSKKMKIAFVAAGQNEEAVKAVVDVPEHDRIDQLLQLENYGKGQLLAIKMGFKPGQGLGKNQQGIRVPIETKVKEDRRAIGGDKK